MSGGVLVAGGLRTNERVLDHGTPEQSRGQRMLALDQLRRWIEKIVQVTINLGRPREHELGSLHLIRPFHEEAKCCSETCESESVFHSPLFGFDVVEIWQL